MNVQQIVENAGGSLSEAREYGHFTVVVESAKGKRREVTRVRVAGGTLILTTQGK